MEQLRRQIFYEKNEFPLFGRSKGCDANFQAEYVKQKSVNCLKVFLARI